MAEMTFDGGIAKQRSMLVPILLAVLVLAALGAWFAKTYVHASVSGSVDRVALFPLHVEYKRGPGMLVGANETQDELYVVADVSLTGRTEVPLFIKELTGSFIGEDGSLFEAHVIDKNDLPRLMAMFPKLKSTADGIGTPPLVRESSIAKGATGRGYVVLLYNIPQSVWDKRKSAEVSIDFYHQDKLTLALPS